MGAVLVFAVDASLSGVDVQVLGRILLLVGLASAALGTLAASSVLPRRREERIVER